VALCFTLDAAPNGPAMQTLSNHLAAYDDYAPMQSSQLIPSDGSLLDFAYGELGLPALHILLGTADFQDCVSFNDVILPDHLPALMDALKSARRPFRLTAGPVVRDLGISSVRLPGRDAMLIEAIVDDAHYLEGSGEPVQAVAGARCYLDIPPWEADAVPVAMTAADGAFNETSEAVFAELDVSGLPEGRHTLYMAGEDAAGNEGLVSAAFFNVNNQTSVGIAGFPARAVLLPIQPNPFNPQTTVLFDLPRTMVVELAVYDLTGRLVRVLAADEVYSAGSHSVGWRGLDTQGRAMPSGTYLVRLQSEDGVQSRKVSLIR